MVDAAGPAAGTDVGTGGHDSTVDDADDADDAADAVDGAAHVAAERGALRAAAERLIFFSDAVVAIAITLLALELPVPTGETDRQVLGSLAANSFAYVTFLISFLVIGAHWRAHHRVFRYLHRVDALFVRLSFTWLLVIVTMPFLTEVIREGQLGVVRFGLYALSQVLLQVVFGTLQHHAGRRGLFAPGTPARIVRQPWWVTFAGPAAYLVSIPLYPLLGAWAFAVWVVVPNLSSVACRTSRWTRRGSVAR